jgi:hypothetical protein
MVRYATSRRHTEEQARSEVASALEMWTRNLSKPT